MIRTTKSQAGLTLIEMMIALLIGLIITAGVLTIFVSNIKSSTENTKMIRMNQQLRSTMSFITDELKRAGYSGDSTTSAFNDELNFNDSPPCLRYAYDENADGIMQSNERLGFQLKDSAIEWGKNVSSTDCTNGSWQAITDTNIVQITNFSVQNKLNYSETDPNSSESVNMVSTAASTIKVPQFAVILTGEVAIPPDKASRTIKAFIRVRNDCAEGDSCD
jgi:prepilin-type N-terminal cleavage/methylation domain-containing protein